MGVATGLAWTQTGGELLFVEAALMPGSGKVETTGKLGDVMQESKLYFSLPLHTGRIIAAGGVSSIGDIQALKGIGVSGAVVGKALYEKNFDLKEALAVASSRPQR